MMIFKQAALCWFACEEGNNKDYDATGTFRNHRDNRQYRTDRKIGSTVWYYWRRQNERIVWFDRYKHGHITGQMVQTKLVYSAQNRRRRNRFYTSTDNQGTAGRNRYTQLVKGRCCQPQSPLMTRRVPVAVWNVNSCRSSSLNTHPPGVFQPRWETGCREITDIDQLQKCHALLYQVLVLEKIWTGEFITIGKPLFQNSRYR